MAIIICRMWICSILKNGIIHGIRSPILATVLWAMPVIMFDFLGYFARVFRLIEPRDMPNGPDMLALAWNDIRDEHIV